MPRQQRRRGQNRYSKLIEKIFFAHWRNGMTQFEFERDELRTWAKKLEVKLPDNLGDLIYSFRFRSALPEAIVRTQPKGKEW